MNLLDETKSAISRSKHSTDDVRFVGSRDEKLGIPWSQAEKVLDIDYDDGYGSQEIAADLVVAFTDGGFLRREEYDGSEWWEYEPPFRGPETQKPFGRVKRTYPAYSLEDINYPMEATEGGNGRRQMMSYKAKIFTREEFREVVAAAIYDYEQAPAKCLYTTKDAADQLYGHYGEETEVEE